jgi:hypothetical protein
MLIGKIERFLRKTCMPPTVFGRQAMGDPRFVGDLRNGREPREATVARVKAFMDTYAESTHAH